MKSTLCFFTSVGVFTSLSLAGCGEDTKDDTAADDCVPSDEVCDDIDNDCDGEIDESDALDASAWYYDGDSDGYGADHSLAMGCSQSNGFVDVGGDCDDDEPTLNPDTYWYADADLDGYGDPDEFEQQCVRLNGYVADDTDCDDTRDDVNPGEDEQCDDVDHDCDDDSGMVDADADGVAECEGDCDDTDPTIYPGADEYCDGIDHDCDGMTNDDDAVDAPTWYLDYDADGYGVTDHTVVQCDQPDGFVADSGDCDDLDDAVYPGAPETSGDGLDSDCDGDEG